jgi:hypothetical protein
MGSTEGIALRQQPAGRIGVRPAGYGRREDPRPREGAAWVSYRLIGKCRVEDHVALEQRLHFLHRLRRRDGPRV